MTADAIVAGTNVVAVELHQHMKERNVTSMTTPTPESPPVDFTWAVTESDHFQFYYMPDTAAERGIAPGYEEKTFPADGKRGRLQLIVSPDGRDGSLKIHQDVAMHAAILAEGQTAALDLAPGRHAWVQVARAVP